MNLRLFYTLLVIVCTFCCFSCHTEQSEAEEEVTEVADSFATKYYTWHFVEAQNFSNEEMKMHLTFLASNVSEDDLKQLLESNTIPQISVSKVTIEGENTATADIDLKDVFMMDTLGYMAHLCTSLKQQLVIKRDGESWKVTGIK